jgi:hypothetical protein
LECPNSTSNARQKKKPFTSYARRKGEKRSADADTVIPIMTSNLGVRILGNALVLQNLIKNQRENGLRVMRTRSSMALSLRDLLIVIHRAATDRIRTS